MKKILVKKFNIPTPFETEQYVVGITINKYIYYTILIVILLLTLCKCFFCIRHRYNYQILSEDIQQKEIQMTNLIKVSTDDNNL